MSRYEALRDERRQLRARQALAVAAPAIILCLVAIVLASDGVRLLAGIAALVVGPPLLHGLWLGTVPAYRARSARLGTIRAEIAAMRRHVGAIFARYRTRRKGEQFKRVYSLAGRTVRDLEEALSVGMFHERREVFVTAFMRHGVAVRVTASVGTPFRCRAADNPARWQEHVARLRCDEIRQYHNHPAHGGSTVPSRTDIRSSAAIRRLLGPHGAKLRSLLICWNDLREWKVFEYDGAGRHVLHFEFDAGA